MFPWEDVRDPKFGHCSGQPTGQVWREPNTEDCSFMLFSVKGPEAKMGAPTRKQQSRNGAKFLEILGRVQYPLRQYFPYIPIPLSPDPKKVPVYGVYHSKIPK